MLKFFIKSLSWLIAKIIITIKSVMFITKAKKNKQEEKIASKEKNATLSMADETTSNEDENLDKKTPNKATRTGAKNVQPDYKKILKRKKNQTSFKDQVQKKPKTANEKVKSKEDRIKEMQSKKKKGSSFSDKVSKSPNLVYLIRGKDKGKPAWHYVLVEKNKLHLFLKETQGGTINVADYGKVIKSGWGEEPSKEIVESIEKEYGSS